MKNLRLVMIKHRFVQTRFGVTNSARKAHFYSQGVQSSKCDKVLFVSAQQRNYPEIQTQGHSHNKRFSKTLDHFVYDFKLVGPYAAFML